MTINNPTFGTDTACLPVASVMAHAPDEEALTEVSDLEILDNIYSLDQDELAGLIADLQQSGLFVSVAGRASLLVLASITSSKAIHADEG